MKKYLVLLSLGMFFYAEGKDVNSEAREVDLEEAVASAYNNNAGWKAEQAAKNAADAQYKQSKTVFLPTLDASLKASRVSSGPKKLIQSFFFDWTFFDNEFLKIQKQAKKEKNDEFIKNLEITGKMIGEKGIKDFTELDNENICILVTSIDNAMKLKYFAAALLLVLGVGCSQDRKGTLDLKSEEDLTGLTVSVSAGSYYQSRFSGREDITLFVTNAEADGIQAVRQGTADVYVSDEVMLTKDDMARLGIKMAFRGEECFDVAFAIR